jgi:hypothetical protein
MRGSGLEERRMGGGSSIGLMDSYMKGSSRTMNVMGQESYFILAAKSLRDSGKTGRKMEDAIIPGLQVLGTRSSI